MKIVVSDFKRDGRKFVSRDLYTLLVLMGVIK